MGDNSKKQRRNFNRDIADIVLYPVYQKLGNHVPSWISPNSITLAGSLIGVIGSLLIIFINSPIVYILTPICYIIYHLFDTLDGYHARRTGKESAIGDFLDHSLDGIVVLIFYIALIYRFELNHIFYVLLVAMRAYDTTLFQCTLRATGNPFNPPVGPATEVWLFSIGYILCFLLPEYQNTIVFYGCVFACIAIVISISTTYMHTLRNIASHKGTD